MSLQGCEGAGGHRSFSQQTIALQRNTQTAMGHARQGGRTGTADRGQACGLPLNGRSAGQPLQAALLQGRGLPSLQRWELIKTAAVQFISKQQIQGRRTRYGRKRQKGFAVFKPDQPPKPAGMTGPAIRGCRRTQPLLPDPRHRCRGVRLKTLNQPCPLTDLKQLCCSTTIQGRRLQAGCTKQQGGQKKSTTPEEGLCRDGVQVDVGWTQSGGRLVG